MAFPDSTLAGKYTQIQLVGQGAHGKVYRAVDNLRRVVAVKEVLPSCPGYLDTLEQFAKEVRLHAALNHANIVKVYHLEEDGPSREQYLICEYVDGGSLADHLLQARGPLPEQEALRITLDICDALEELERKGIVHRDIKPSNILLCKDDQGRITAAKLADFGVAKDLDKRRAGQPTTRLGIGHPGTPEYMAPEQADGARPVDVRTDLYALGICLWEMLTGTDYKLVAASGPPALLASPGVAKVIQGAIQDRPADRYERPQAMAAALQKELLRQPPTAKRTIRLRPRRKPGYRRAGLLAAGLLALALLLASGAYWLWAQTWAYEREGEIPDGYTVGQTLTRSRASQLNVHGQFGTVPAWPAQGGYVRYDGVLTPQLSHLYLKLRYSKHSPPTAHIEVFIDDEPEPRAALAPLDQGDWDRFVWSEPIDLGRVGFGEHSIRFATVGQEYGVADLDLFTLSTRP